jgi:hypothetical protein
MLDVLPCYGFWPAQDDATYSKSAAMSVKSGTVKAKLGSVDITIFSVCFSS